jgi:surface carbohydrate biosynthesis protein (TIGR04326 family)
MNSDATLTVLDHILEQTESKGEVLYWKSYRQESSNTSIPEYVEENADRLRNRYISFIHDLGETNIHGKRIVEHLSIGNNFSFWWMSLLAEKSPFKSPRIYDCLRLFALEEILIEKKPSKLVLISSDVALIGSIKKLCFNRNIIFTSKKLKPTKRCYSLRRLYDVLPYSLQGLISLRHIAYRWALRKVKKTEWASDNGSIFFCSYFYNLDASLCNKGIFYSRQWEIFPEYLGSLGKKMNWIHHFIDGPGMPDKKTTLQWIKYINENPHKQGFHSLLDSYLSYGVIRKVIYKWALLNVAAWRLNKISDSFNCKDSKAWLWPLLKNDWYASLIGAVAIKNCLWVELFDVVFKEMPQQSMGFYLWENQGWENAMLHAWNKHGHGKIIGVQHATVRFWSVNCFDDARIFNVPDVFNKPLPNNIAVNGSMAWKELLNSGYPEKRLLKVEALRYLYLNTVMQDKLNAKKKTQDISSRHDTKIKTKILVLGDITYKQTFRMLNLVERAINILNIELSITLKPHPACPFNNNDYPTLSFNCTDRHLSEIIQNYDLTFTGNTTSASLDVYIAGRAVVVYLDGEYFNLSPLRGVENVTFVVSAKELAATITSHASEKKTSVASDYFWLDTKFPKWNKIINLNEKTMPNNYRR